MPTEYEIALISPDTQELSSELVSLICISVLAAAMGSKTTRDKIRSINYARFLVILLYFCSWAFCASSMLLASTSNFNIVSCTLGLLGCDVFYAGSKVIIYAWLIERVHMVTAFNTPRMKSFQYKLHLFLLSPFLVIFALMVSFKNVILEENGICTIGIQLVASVPLLIYDMLFNCYLTWLFVRPLVTSFGRTHVNGPKSPWSRSKLYKLTRRTLASSSVCLLVTLCNTLSVVLTKGLQRGIICLTLCTLDVTINVITVHWVTASSAGESNKKGTVYDHSEEKSPYSFGANYHTNAHQQNTQGIVFENFAVDQPQPVHVSSNQRNSVSQ